MAFIIPSSAPRFGYKLSNRATIEAVGGSPPCFLNYQVWIEELWEHELRVNGEDALVDSEFQPLPSAEGWTYLLKTKDGNYEVFDYFKEGKYDLQVYSDHRQAALDKANRLTHRMLIDVQDPLPPRSLEAKRNWELRLLYDSAHLQPEELKKKYKAEDISELSIAGLINRAKEVGWLEIFLNFRAWPRGPVREGATYILLRPDGLFEVFDCDNARESRVQLHEKFEDAIHDKVDRFLKFFGIKAVDSLSDDRFQNESLPWHFQVLHDFLTMKNSDFQALHCRHDLYPVDAAVVRRVVDIESRGRDYMHRAALEDDSTFLKLDEVLNKAFLEKMAELRSRYHTSLNQGIEAECLYRMFFTTKKSFDRFAKSTAMKDLTIASLMEIVCAENWLDAAVDGNWNYPSPLGWKWGYLGKRPDGYFVFFQGFDRGVGARPDVYCRDLEEAVRIRINSYFFHYALERGYRIPDYVGYRPLFGRS